MRRKIILWLLFFLFLRGLHSGQRPKTIQDALGSSFTVSASPQRIVSLAPNITEILFTLNLGPKIVGVTRYCDFPPPALEIEKIGGMIDPNLEKIKALNPDLIIGFRGNPLRFLHLLKRLGLPLFVLDMGSSLESVFVVIRKIGVVTQKEKEAEILLQSMKEKYNNIQKALRDVKRMPKVFISLHGMDLWTCGKGSFLDDLVKKAKADNIAGHIQRKWLLLNREQLIRENPEIIIIVSKSKEDFKKAKKWIKNENPFGQIEAVISDRIYFLDENKVTRPGPRFIEAFAEIARILHPQRFEEEKKNEIEKNEQSIIYF